LRDERIAAFGYDPVSDQTAMVPVDHHIARPDGGGPVHVQKVAGPQRGKHAAACDGKAGLAAGGEEFGSQVEFDCFYQMVFG
jgi:hypothetical protein